MSALPDEYKEMTGSQADEIIIAAKKALGSKLLILGHHYQRDEVIKYADCSGDSLELSHIAARKGDADYIVFCGVHFMAESADILSADNQKVILPDTSAGCSMADMANITQVKESWKIFKNTPELPHRIVPITYINSSAEIKAFCGRNGGLCCTSGNARAVLESVWKDDPDAIVFFLPDQYLGRNTVNDLGVDLEYMVTWNPYKPNGGNTDKQLTMAKAILWYGGCQVHQEFTARDIARVKKEDASIKVIVHPECNFDVAQAADITGSTSKIIKMVEVSAKGDSWAIGTESTLVDRLAKRMADRGVKIKSLSESDTFCQTMYSTTRNHLAWILDNILSHSKSPDTVKLQNQIIVDETISVDAKVALTRMLDVTG